MDWEVTEVRKCDRTTGCPGFITVERREVHHVMHLPWFMGGDEDNRYETAHGYDWAEGCDTCDWQDAEPYTY